MSTTQCPYCLEEIQAGATKCKHCQTWLPATHEAGPAGVHGLYNPVTGTRLVRSTTDRMWAGVCGGLGRYLGIDPTLVRICVAVATFFTAFVPGLVLYLIFALVIPRDDAPGY